jgi:hypothetical protein
MRIKQDIEIPSVLSNGNVRLNAIKKYDPKSILVGTKIQEQFPLSNSTPQGQYFVEIRDDLASQQGKKIYKDSLLE